MACKKVVELKYKCTEDFCPHQTSSNTAWVCKYFVYGECTDAQAMADADERDLHQ